MIERGTHHLLHVESVGILAHKVRQGGHAGHRSAAIVCKMIIILLASFLACKTCFFLPVQRRWSLPSSRQCGRSRRCGSGCESTAWGQTSRQCGGSDAHARLASNVRATEELRFLQPLETMNLERSIKPAASSVQEGLVMPCFPLPLARAALPGSRRTINICEARYIEMINDLLLAGKRRFVVPRLRYAWGKPPTRGVELAESAVVFELLNVRDPPVASRFRFICSHEVKSPIRITQVLNPEAYAEKNTYLRVECQEFSDRDLDIVFKMEERALLDALYEVARLRASTGDPLRRLEYVLDARGQPSLIDHNLLPTISEDSLGLTGVCRDRFWELAALWQGYCDRRGISLRQQLEHDSNNRGASEVAELRRNYEAEATDFARSTSDLMQGLLQAETHGARLVALQTAADQEVQRLGAIAAIQTASGGEATV